MSNVPRVLLLALVLLTAPGCLVLTLTPSHDRESQVWMPELLGEWQNTDDNMSLKIAADEWRSYAIEYAHPIEKGQLTGYLTTIGKGTYMDVMPARGEDRGSFLLPVHALVRIRIEGEELEVVALSYDWFFERVRKKVAIPGLTVMLDEKENAVIGSPTAAFRSWLAKQPLDGPVFGAKATFRRTKK